jgi:glutamate 5-kinase
MAGSCGTVTWITGASGDKVITRLREGEHVGTRIAAGRRDTSAYKLWLRYAKPVSGTIGIDAGAVEALRERGASLLPVGVRSVDGAFAAGASVDICGPDGVVVARGICEFSAVDLQTMITRPDNVQRGQSVVHRDQLVLIGAGMTVA